MYFQAAQITEVLCELAHPKNYFPFPTDMNGKFTMHRIPVACLFLKLLYVVSWFSVQYSDRVHLLCCVGQDTLSKKDILLNYLTGSLEATPKAASAG